VHQIGQLQASSIFGKNIRSLNATVARLAIATACIGSCIGVGGCGSDGSVTPTPIAKRLVVEGRLERGLAVRVMLASDRDTVPVTGATLAVSPVGSASIAGDSVLLVQAGAIHITATVGSDTTSLDTTVAVPPSIVFDAVVDGDRDIYRAMLDGAGLVRLTTSLSEDSHPTAAGQTIVFASYRTGNGELYMIGADGTGEHRLSTTTANETLPALSPNGRSIAYVSDAGGLTKVWLTSIAFVSPRELVTAAAGDAAVESGVAWSPASDRLVFVSTATPAARSGLFVAPATPGAAATWVTGSGTLGPDVEPSWSASGDKVAYASARGDTTTIFIRDLTTGVETEVVHGRRSLGQPAWLADGRIVFTDFASSRAPVLEWVDPAAPTVIHLVPTPGVGAQHASPLTLP
jgi:Tol biopolymer transport system component